MKCGLPIEYHGLAQPRPLPRYPTTTRVLRVRERLPVHLDTLLKCLCAGMALKEAASFMGITYYTSKAYLDRARKLMSKRTTAQLIAWYVAQRTQRN